MSFEQMLISSEMRTKADISIEFWKLSRQI
jgi:hypothetical protein